MPLSSEERAYLFSFVGWANRLPRRDVWAHGKEYFSLHWIQIQGRAKQQRQKNKMRRMWWGLHGKMRHQWRLRPPCRKTRWGSRWWRWLWEQQRRQTTARSSTGATRSGLTLHSTVTQWRKHQLHEPLSACAHCYSYQVLEQQCNSCQRAPVCSISSGVRGPDDTRHTTNQLFLQSLQWERPWQTLRVLPLSIYPIINSQIQRGKWREWEAL